MSDLVSFTTTQANKTTLKDTLDEKQKTFKCHDVATLCRWRDALALRYYSKKDKCVNFSISWEDRDSRQKVIEVPLKCSSPVKHDMSKTFVQVSWNNQLCITVTLYFLKKPTRRRGAGSCLIQGILCQEWAQYEFDILCGLVDKLMYATKGSIDAIIRGLPCLPPADSPTSMDLPNTALGPPSPCIASLQSPIEKNVLASVHVHDLTMVTQEPPVSNQDPLNSCHLDPHLADMDSDKDSTISLAAVCQDSAPDSSSPSPNATVSHGADNQSVQPTSTTMSQDAGQQTDNKDQPGPQILPSFPRPSTPHSSWSTDKNETDQQTKDEGQLAQQIPLLQSKVSAPLSPHETAHHSPDQIHKSTITQYHTPSTLFKSATISSISVLQKQLQTAFQTIANMQKTITRLHHQLDYTNQQVQQNIEQTNDSETRVKNTMKATSDDFTRKLQDFQTTQSTHQQQIKETNQTLKSHRDSQANSLADIKNQIKSLNATKPTNYTKDTEPTKPSTHTQSTETDDTLLYSISTGNKYALLSNNSSNAADHDLQQTSYKQNTIQTGSQINISSHLRHSNINTTSKHGNTNSDIQRKIPTSSPLDILMTKTVPQDCDMLLLGDSVIEGLDVRQVKTGYRVSKVAASGLTVYHLQHWLSTCPEFPHIAHVTFHVGINDCWKGPVSTADWGKLLQSLRRVFPNATLQASSIIPPRGKHHLYNPASTTTANLRDACRQEHVAYINNTRSFLARSGAPKKSMYSDSLHPSNQGYKCLVENISWKVNFQKPSTNTHPPFHPSPTYQSTSHNYSSAPPLSRADNNLPQPCQIFPSTILPEDSSYNEAFPLVPGRDPQTFHVVQALGQPMPSKPPPLPPQTSSSHCDSKNQPPVHPHFFPTFPNTNMPPPKSTPARQNLSMSPLCSLQESIPKQHNQLPVFPNMNVPPTNSSATLQNLPMGPPHPFHEPVSNQHGHLHPLVVQFLNSMATQFTSQS